MRRAGKGTMVEHSLRSRTGMVSHARRSAGVTIIEVLATAIILAIGLVGVGSMVTYGVVSHRKSVNYTIAAERATKELERIREAGYLGATISTALFPADEYTIENGTQASFEMADLASGTGVITIADDPAAQATNPATGQPYSNLKRVSVQISWGGNRYLHGSYEAVTLIANRP